ncbi:fasciclin domain-containing protein [Parasphingopyxis marina]|uniref:Fasciclin domain-containing protein n=1 Tax=Parasphingopyxis marina TaxID=2761622 RepID=A0A842HZD0_9SPHN|nr:fasciclin domain-containing protein [Parasphingopyxis marina]MBC2777290.1 fasciclin domain-containing protein [Parasphingopyxis marina]
MNLKRKAGTPSVSLALAAFAMTSTPALADHHEGEAEAPAEAAAATDAEASADAETSEAVTVGGAEMLPTQTIVTNASNASNLTTLVAAIEQAELVDTLSGPGPYTVFAPTNEAFGMLPDGIVDQLMQDAVKAQLAQILSYHVLPGELDAETLTQRIEAAGGELLLTTVEGSPLRATIVNGAVALHDELGGVGYVTQPDVHQSNGIVHVINGVLLPQPETGDD